MRLWLVAVLGFVVSCSGLICTDPIGCRLNSIEIAVPDFCLPDQDICIEQFLCGEVGLKAIPSLYEFPTDLEVGLRSLQAACSFDYAYKRFISGSVTASVSQTDFLVELHVDQDSNQYYPLATSFSSCNLSSIDVNIDFDSSGLDYLAPVLEKATIAAIHRVLCVKVADFVATNVTSFILNQLDPTLAVMIASEPSPLPQYDARYYLSWDDSFLSTLHSLVDSIQGLSPSGDIVQCLLKQPSLLRKIIPPEMGRGIFKDDSFSSIAVELPSLPVAVPALSVALGTNLTVSLISLELDGLDTVKDLEILEPMVESNVSLHTRISFERVSATVGVRVNFSTTYSEVVALNLKLDGFDLLADVAIAINQFVLESFHLDQMTSINCWLDVLTEFSIANLQLKTHIDDMSITQLSGDAGSLETDLAALLNNGLSLVYEGFAVLLTDSLNGAMQGPLRTGFNDWISRSLSEAKSQYPCTTHFPYSDVTNDIVWATSPLVQALSGLLNDRIGAAGVNQIMNCFTNNTGNLILNTTRLSLEIEGLNSFYELTVLGTNQSEPYLLKNQVGLGLCDETHCNPVRVVLSTYDLMTSFLLPPQLLLMQQAVMESSPALKHEIANQFTAEVSVTNFELVLDLFWQMNKNGLKDLTVGKLSTTGCTASTMSALSIDAFQLSVGRSNLTVNGISYDVTKLAQGVMEAVSESKKVDERNAAMEYQLSVADQTCKADGVPPAPAVSEDDVKKDTSLSTVQWCLVALGTVLVGFVGAVLYSRRRQQQQKSATSQLPFWKRYDFSQALAYDSKIPKWLRYGFPIAIICNFVLFVYSDLQDISVAMMEIITPAITYDIGEVYNFKFGDVSQDMWDAKVYALDILMVSLSGVWPNIKLAIMLAMWFIPLGLLSTDKRETVMIVVDTLGKWCLIDFFVMMLLMCAFYFKLYFGEGIIVNVTMQPRFGFYGFLASTMFSQLLGHVLLACHRASLKDEVVEEAEKSPEVQSLSSWQFEMNVSQKEVTSLFSKVIDKTVSTISDKANSLKRSVLKVGLTRSGTVVVVIVILLTAALLVAGTYKLVMTFEFKGMVGWMLKDKAVAHYSFINMGEALPEHSGTPHSAGIFWFQFAFFMFGIGMPGLLLLASLVLWLVPLTVLAQERLTTLSEVCNSWSALDVYGVSIIAALFEIQQFAAFMVGDSCDRINQVLRYFDKALEGDDKCFDVVALLLPDAWIVFLAAISINMVGMCTLHLSGVSLKQRTRGGEILGAEEGFDGYTVMPDRAVGAEGLKNDAVASVSTAAVGVVEEASETLVSKKAEEDDDEEEGEYSSWWSKYCRVGQISLVALLHRIHLITVKHHQKWSSSY